MHRQSVYRETTHWRFNNNAADKSGNNTDLSMVFKRDGWRAVAQKIAAEQGFLHGEGYQPLAFKAMLI